jgi:hypothetical protein
MICTVKHAKPLYFPIRVVSGGIMVGQTTQSGHLYMFGLDSEAILTWVYPVVVHRQDRERHNRAYDMHYNA